MGYESIESVKGNAVRYCTENSKRMYMWIESHKYQRVILIIISECAKLYSEWVHKVHQTIGGTKPNNKNPKKGKHKKWTNPEHFFSNQPTKIMKWYLLLNFHLCIFSINVYASFVSFCVHSELAQNFSKFNLMCFRTSQCHCILKNIDYYLADTVVQP